MAEIKMSLIISPLKQICVDMTRNVIAISKKATPYYFTSHPLNQLNFHDEQLIRQKICCVIIFHV